jgi:hypothetical protein
MQFVADFQDMADFGGAGWPDHRVRRKGLRERFASAMLFTHRCTHAEPITKLLSQ